MLTCLVKRYICCFVTNLPLCEEREIIMNNTIEILFNTSELTAGTRGASLGPGAIQVAALTRKDPFFSHYEQYWLPSENYRLNQETKFQNVKYIDGLLVLVGSLKTEIKRIVQNQNFPLVIAADHGSAAGTMAGLQAAFPDKRMGVIWIDAHGDLHTPYTTPSGNLHGMPLAVALKEDNIQCKKNPISESEIALWNELKTTYGEVSLKASDLFFIGVRDTEPEENFIIAENNIRNFKVDELRQKGFETLQAELDAFIQRIDILYVSFDVDSMDPELTSYGTGTPVKNGLSFEEGQQIMNYLARQSKLACMEIVEVNPCLDDKKNKMAELTFDIIKSSAKLIEKR